MVAGHLSVKHGNYYAVLNYKNAEGERKTKWVALGLPEKGNKRKAEAELAKLRAEFEIPEEVGDLSSDMLFADYLFEWLEIVRGRIAIATYSSYSGVNQKFHSTLLPQKEADPAGAGSQTFADVLFRNAQKGEAQHRDPLSRHHSFRPQICGQDRYVIAKCGGQGGQAEEKQLSAGVSFGGGNAEDV